MFITRQVQLRYVLLKIVFFSTIFTTKSVYALDFSEAYVQLLNNDLTYRRALLDFKADKTLVPQARADLLPNISARAATGYIRNDVNNLDDPSIDTLSADGEEDQLDFNGDNRRRDEYSINLRLPIYNRTLSTRLKQAKSTVLESELRLQRVLQEQTLTLAEAYFGYQQSKVNLDISQRELNAINSHRLLTLERQDFGLGTRSDVYEAISRYKIAQVQLLEDSKRVGFFADILSRLMQTDQKVFSAKYFTSQPFDSEILNKNRQEIVDNNINNNIEVELQKRVLKSAKLAIRLDRATGFPTLGLNASSSGSETEAAELGDETDRRDDRILLELNVPIFAGSFTNAKTRESRLRYEAEKVQLKNTIATQSEQIYQRLRTKATSFKKMKILEEAFIGSYKALKLREEGFKEGLVESLDVLNAFRDKHRAERSWRESEFEFLNSIVSLSVVLGKVAIDDIKSIDDYFQDSPVTIENEANKKEKVNAIKKTNIDNSTLTSSKVVSVRKQREQEALIFVHNWRGAWESGDIEAYLEFYDSSFRSQEKLSFDEWKRQRQKRISPAKNIKIEIKDININSLGEKGQFLVEFDQNYSASNYSESSSKRLMLKFDQKQFKIISETSL